MTPANDFLIKAAIRPQLNFDIFVRTTNCEMILVGVIVKT
jgi:hypothetical protein